MEIGRCLQRRNLLSPSRGWRASFPLISARRDSQTDQRGNGTRTGLLHDRGPMILDGALADTQIRGYVFAGMTGKNEIENLPLTCRQAIEMRGGGHAPILGSVSYTHLGFRVAIERRSEIAKQNRITSLPSRRRWREPFGLSDERKERE